MRICIICNTNINNINLPVRQSTYSRAGLWDLMEIPAPPGNKLQGYHFIVPFPERSKAPKIHFPSRPFKGIKPFTDGKAIH